jgi:octaprenyl-diphosphate synthase
MSSLEIISAPVIGEIRTFDDYFRDSMKSKAPLLNIITRYILKRKGKQMRPMLVFLSAKLTGGITKATYTAAALIELMHTATLIHDDVVDDAYERRGFFSINALWKNKIAVLIGDYLLSKGLLLAVQDHEYELLEIVSEAVREMAEGELLQIEKARKLDITEEVYFEIIRKKTATLIASCAACGSKSAGANDETIAKLKLFGEYVGMAFQIKDDLFDYLKNGAIGKPTGNDIREQKMTLPLIHALQNGKPDEKKNILRLVKLKKKDTAKVNKIIDFVSAGGGLDYAETIMNQYRDKAIEIIDSFDECPARNSLREFVFFTTMRKK